MIRPAHVDDDLLGIAVDGLVTGLSDERAHELIDAAVIDGDCLVFFNDSGTIDGFVIMHRRAFFGRDFIKLVVVALGQRRRGRGTQLVAAALARANTDKVFISTNHSNLAMRSLLDGAHWTLSGVLDGIDEGDPEMVFWHAGPANDGASPR